MRVFGLRGAAPEGAARAHDLLSQALSGWLKGWSVQPLCPAIEVQPAHAPLASAPASVGGGLELPDGRGLEWSCPAPDRWLAALLALPPAVLAAASWRAEIARAAWADLGAALCAAFDLPAEQHGDETGRSGAHWTDSRTAALRCDVASAGAVLTVLLSAALVERVAARADRRTSSVRLRPRTALVARREVALEARLKLAGVSLQRLRQLHVGDILLSSHRLDAPVPLRVAGRATQIHALVCADTGRRALQIHQLEEPSHGSFAR